MEKQVKLTIPARTVEGELIDVYSDGTSKFRYLDHFDDHVRILKDVIVPTEQLGLE